MSSSYKNETRITTVSAAIADGLSALVELGEECDEAADNFASPDHPKAEAFREVANSLTGLSVSPDDLPEDLADQSVTYSERVPRSKRRAAGRAVRRDNATGMLTAAADALQNWLDSNEEHEDWDNVSTIKDELESSVSEAECVEFPGMFG